MAKSYQEDTIAFSGDPLTTGAQLADSLGNEDYILYETDDGWSLGMGIRAQMEVYPEYTVMNDGDNRQVFRNVDLSKTIDGALATVSVDGWRAYGTAEFEFARLIYGLDLTDKDGRLMNVFIPQSEVRYSKSDSSLQLRALDAQTLDGLKSRVESITTSDTPDRFQDPEVIPLEKLPEVDIHDAEKYMSAVSEALEQIRNHEYRKVIISRQVPLSRKIDMAASYVTGRRGNTPSRSYLVNLDGRRLAGFSPETVVEVNGQGTVFTTPLAGTRAIGDDVLQELNLREELVSDSKEIAEHAISVYVAFDEMSMVCEEGTVAVGNFMIVSRRGSVQHLASRLNGKLAEHHTAWHAFGALFPAVTASGVPKRESIDAIGRIEGKPRGLYSGCVLTCDQSGEFDSALILRSFYEQDGNAWMQAGAGIMNMSDPIRELEETREKLRSCARFLVPA